MKLNQIDIIETQNGHLGPIGTCLNGEKLSQIRIGRGPILDSLTLVHLGDQNYNSVTPSGVRPIGDENRHIMPQFLCRNSALKVTLS